MRFRTVDGQPVAAKTPPPSASIGPVVCELVGQLSDTPTHDLPPLGVAIDPDALDAVFPPEATGGSLTFPYAGFDVVVEADRTVEIYPEAVAPE